MPAKIERIIVPLDGSELSERVLPLAIEMAARSGASILLLSVPQVGEAEISIFADYQFRLTDTMPPAAMNRLRDSLRDETREYLEVLERQCEEREVAASILVAENDPAAAIVDAASQRRGSFVVMATHGRSGLGRWAFGSVAERVIQEASGPLLLVPAAADHISSEPRRILVPLDGSTGAEAVLHPVSVLARVFDADIELAHVLPPFEELSGAGLGRLIEIQQKYEHWLRDYMRTVTSELEGRELRVSSVEVEGPEVANGILAQAARDDVDLLAMTTRSRTDGARSSLGTVVSRVIRSTRTPVLLERASTPA